MKNIDVIVNTCNRDEDLKRCLESLKNQTYKDFEILIIDNGDSKIAKDYTNRVIKDNTKKLSYLFNLGWKNAKTDIIAYIADDAEADCYWLENILKTFETIPQAGAVSGPVISSCYPSGEIHRLYLVSQKNRFLQILSRPYFSLVFENKILEPGRLCQSGAYTIGAGLAQSKNIPTPIEIDLLTTTSMGIKKDILESLGGFDENFWFNHADGDLFVRMKKKDYKLIFNPTVVVKHHIRMGPSRDPYFIGRDTAYFFLKDIKPKRLQGWIGFFLNILTLNNYWLYKAVQMRQVNQLRGITGFFMGINDYIKRAFYNR